MHNKAPTDSDDGLSPIQRWSRKHDCANGLCEMNESADGEWIQYEDMRHALLFVTGYLDGHASLLEGIGAHSQVANGVRWIMREIEKL